VRNGTAYDTAVLALHDHDTVVIPSRAELKTSANDRSIGIELAKTLGFMGHPTERDTIDAGRNDMGCAWRSDAGKLYLATFGESLCPEGGQTIDLTVTVPKGIHVDRDDTYEMSRSLKHRVTSSKLRRRRENERTWYSAKDRNQKWMPIPDVPNPKRAAQQEHAR